MASKHCSLMRVSFWLFWVGCVCSWLYRVLKCDLNLDPSDWISCTSPRWHCAVDWAFKYQDFGCSFYVHWVVERRGRGSGLRKPVNHQVYGDRPTGRPSVNGKNFNVAVLLDKLNVACKAYSFTEILVVLTTFRGHISVKMWKLTVEFLQCNVLSEQLQTSPDSSIPGK